MRARLALVASGIVALVASAVLVFPELARPGSSVVGQQNGLETDTFPPALAKHLEQVAKTIPGNGGEGDRGSAEEDAFNALAYPGTDISLEQFAAARAAFAAAASKFPRGKGRKDSWVTLGPTEALYPFFGPRDASLYLPNEYVAGGRTVALLMAPTCAPGRCRVWAATAGGGVWRTDNALGGPPVHWTFVSASFEMNAIGSIALDPNDPSGNTLYVGTGEANACGSGCAAGVGIYKSTNGGDTWTRLTDEVPFNGRAVGSIAVKPGDPNTLYAGTTRAIRGISSVCCGGAVSFFPGAAKWGLYRSTDGGASWTFVHNGAATTAGCTGDTTESLNGTPCSPRGVRRVAIDPSDANIVYASSYARGVWRSNDGGATWTQIKVSLNAAATTTRPEIAVTRLANGKTRMYVAEGAVGDPYSRLFRSDDVASGAPTFTDLTSSDPALPGYGSYNYCGGQCWYDNYVYTPAGFPDVVYLGGSYQYGETGGVSNGRGVVLSTDGGVSFTDLTMDATDPTHPNGMHPDQHGLVTVPGDPYRFIASSDGGLIRGSGQFADVSANCDSRGLTPAKLARCKQLLSRVPTLLQSLNKGLSTLQFQSLSVNPFDVNDLQGGTQDNGTWESFDNPNEWLQSMIGDGGQSGFDVADPHFRFHTFAGPEPDVNFSDGAVADWNWIGDPFFVAPREGSQFYIPILSDPRVSRTMYAGLNSVWRTKTGGLGSMDLATFRSHCNEWTGDFPPTVTCGDWVKLGTGTLTRSSLGDRAGGNVVAVERAPADTSTLWAATGAGRIFVSKNADAEPASAVSFTRIDGATTPTRFISGIYVDPANSNHAWISYSGFNATAGSGAPGHLFEATFNPGAGTATFSRLDATLSDLPLNDVVRDDVTGDLYVSSDLGVLRLASGDTVLTMAAPGMPAVEVAGLTVAGRKLYAATHGLGAWSLNLP